MGFLQSERALDRAVAAIRLAKRLEAETPRQVIEVMIAMLDDAETIAAFRSLSFAEGSLRAYVALGLARSEAGPHRELIRGQATRLARMVGEVNIFDIEAVAAGLFRICFGDGTPPFATDTVEVLEILSGIEKLSGFANFSGVAGNYGLPGEPTDIAELVAELRQTDDPLAELTARLTAASEDDDDDEEDDDDGDDDDDGGGDDDDDDDGDDDEEDDDDNDDDD